MTVSNSVRVSRSLCDGATKVFSWNFLVHREEDIAVYVDEAVSGVPTGTLSILDPSVYKVNATFPATSGTVRYPKGGGSALPDGSILEVRRVIEFEQDLSVPAVGMVPGDTLEEALDRAVMLAQQLNDDLNDALDRIGVLEEDATPTPATPGKDFMRSYIDLAAVALKSIPASVFRIYVQFHTLPDATLNLIDRFGPTGFYMRRIRKSHITDLGYPDSSWVRSQDRNAPNTDAVTALETEDYSSITQHSVEGGYWVIDQAPTLHHLGGISDADLATGNILSGTDCTAVANDWVQFNIARNGGTSGYARYGYGTWTWGPGAWRVSGSIDFSNISLRGRTTTIDGSGATIYCDGAEMVPFDFSDAEWMHVTNFFYWGDPSSIPLCFIKTGRILDNNTAARITLSHIHGVYSGNAESKFRVAALWDVASENTVHLRCAWQNARNVGADPYTYAAAFDSCNFLNYQGGPISVTGFTLAEPPEVTTGAAHGLATGDVVVFKMANSSTVEVNSTAFFVTVTDGTHFTLQNLDSSDVDATGYTALAGTNWVFKETWTSGKSLENFPCATMQESSRLTPFKQHSNKHKVHIGCRFDAPDGDAAILLGEAEDNKFIGCFGTGREGWIFMFAENSVGFSSCEFNLHLEDGASGVVLDWARFLGIDPAGNAQVNCNDTVFGEVGLRGQNSMFRISGTWVTESVKMIGGKIVCPRFSADFTALELFPNAVTFDLIGTQVLLEKLYDSGNPLINTNDHSGTYLDVTGERAITVLPTYTVAGVPTASEWTRGMIYVSDEVGGATLAFSDGTNWRRVQDRIIVS